jgi:LAGLIDADG endonuclease
MSALAHDAWFSGFADGEGSFGIYARGKSGWAPVFDVRLRADELPILVELRVAFGGRLNFVQARAGAAPQVHWRVASKGDMQRLAAYFDAYPLRAKKARDYVIWRRAVEIYAWFDCNAPELPVLGAALSQGRAFHYAEVEQVEIGPRLAAIEGGRA